MFQHSAIIEGKRSLGQDISEFQSLGTVWNELECILIRQWARIKEWLWYLKVSVKGLIANVERCVNDNEQVIRLKGLDAVKIGGA